MRSHDGSSIFIVTSGNLIEGIKGCLAVCLLKHRFTGFLVDGYTLQCGRLAVCLLFLALLFLLQHLLVALLQLLGLLLRNGDTVALCGFIEGTVGELLQLFIGKLWYVFSRILYVFTVSLYVFTVFWYTKHGFVLGLNVCVCLIEFCLWVDGLTKREQLVRAGKLILASLCITDNNTLIRIAHVNAGTIGEHHDIALDNVHWLVVNLHGCRLDNAHILMGVSLHIGFNLLALAVGGFIRSVHNALHCCLGIDIVEYSVLLVFA